MAKANYKGWIGRDTGNVTTGSTVSKTGNLGKRLRVFLNGGHGSRMMKSTLLALTGAVVGGASKAYSVAQVTNPSNAGQAGRNDLGGKRQVALTTKQSGVTVAADLTDFDQSVAAKTRLANYPRNKSGFAPGNINKL